MIGNLAGICRCASHPHSTHILAPPEYIQHQDNNAKSLHWTKNALSLNYNPRTSAGLSSPPAHTCGSWLHLLTPDYKPFCRASCFPAIEITRILPGTAFRFCSAYPFVLIRRHFKEYKGHRCHPPRLFPRIFRYFRNIFFPQCLIMQFQEFFGAF